MLLILQSAFGFLALLLIAWLISENRRAVPWRIVISGALLQIVLAAALLKVPLFRDVFLTLNELLSALEKATQAGTSFVFGFLAGGSQPFEERPGTSSFVLAFHSLPLILVVSALSALLFHWRILPFIVRSISAALGKTMGVGGAEGLSAAANIFVGMVEAPLFVRPYLREMSRGERADLQRREGDGPRKRRHRRGVRGARGDGGKSTQTQEILKQSSSRAAFLAFLSRNEPTGRVDAAA